MTEEEKGLDRTELERKHSRKPEANPGNISEDPEPHHALSNPVGDPDPTEYPDPYEKREDPRGPDSEQGAQRGPSTSEPHPPDYDDENPPPQDD
jgi:hypothetical protein